jgi:hypothetical protein
MAVHRRDDLSYADGQDDLPEVYPDSEDVRWFYLACRCAACGLAGCYADWQTEYLGYRELLENV